MLICRALAFSSRLTMLLALVFIPATAQTSFRGVLDSDVLFPHFSGQTVGSKDPAALAELQANVQASGLSTWAGMKAVGSVSESGADDSLPATYSMLPLNRMKMDIARPEGHYVLTVNGLQGTIQHPDGSTGILSSAFAIAGIAGFDIAQSVLTSPAAYSVIDGGIVSISGVPMHRISIEVALQVNALESDPHAVVDYYFDPNTHCLQKTASVVTLPGAGNQRFLRVVSYGNYATVGSMMLPFSISETLNGVATWSLSISTIDATNTPSPDIF